MLLGVRSREKEGWERGERERAVGYYVSGSVGAFFRSVVFPNPVEAGMISQSAEGGTEIFCGSGKTRAALNAQGRQLCVEERDPAQANSAQRLQGWVARHHAR